MMKKRFACLISIGLFFSLMLPCATHAADTLPSLISFLEFPDNLEFCGEPVPLDNQEIRERFEREFLLTVWNEPQVILWLKRSTRYFPIIEEMLKKNGLPDDLKFVAVAESALRPHAGSRKGAVGFWQFVKYTGKKQGLVIDGRSDQRRNIYASTEAAIRFFKQLYLTFESWTMAAAAFNMGEDGLRTERLEQGTGDFLPFVPPA